MSEEVLNWDDVEISDEMVTEEDVVEAESMGRLPVGKWLCTVEETVPRIANLTNYTCIAVNLKMRVEETIEINGKPVEGDEGNVYEGRFIWDDVLLEHPDEKDGMRKRRILIAKRFGLIAGDQPITKRMWAEDIIGKQIIITTEEQKWEDKFGVEKTAIKVAFNGYESVDSGYKSVNSATSAADNFDDI